MYWIHYYHIYMHMYDGILSSIQRARKLYIYSFLLLSYNNKMLLFFLLLCRDLYYTLTWITFFCCAVKNVGKDR